MIVTKLRGFGCLFDYFDFDLEYFKNSVKYYCLLKEGIHQSLQTNDLQCFRYFYFVEITAFLFLDYKITASNSNKLNYCQEN